MSNPNDDQQARLNYNFLPPPPPLPQSPVESWPTMHGDQVALLNYNPLPPLPLQSLEESWPTMYDDQVALPNYNPPPPPENRTTMYDDHDQVAFDNNNNNPPPPPVERWTREHDMKFETALLNYPEGSLNRWENIAALFPGRTPSEMRYRYDLLLRDLSEIEAGLTELPRYTDDDEVGGGTGGKPWTEDEHRRFLAGMEKYGKGDWRSISRIFVVTRTSTQVASHAQKYFQRQSASTKERKRSSIHDITSPTPLTTS